VSLRTHPVAIPPETPPISPPWSLESEVAVLGGVLVATKEDQVSVAQVLEALEPTAFFRDGHRELWKAMQALHPEGGILDIITVADHLQRIGELEQVGGLEYLAELLDVVPTAANIRSHARIVRENAERRRVAEYGQDLARSAGSVPMAELRGSLQRGAELLGGVGMGPPGRSAREILEDPETAKAPEPLVVPFAYRGRLTVLSAREKVGKTTLAVAGMAAVTRGRPWAGERTRRAPVAWWPGPTESTPGDVAALFQTFDGDSGHFYLVEEGGEPFGLLQRALETWEPAVLVVDSLSAVARGLDLDSGDARGWHSVMARLGSLARRYDAAVVVIHHGRKEDGSYRDSTAIGAGADVLVSVKETEVEGERELKAVGRWKIPSVTLRLVEPEGGPSRFEPVGEGLSVDTLVALHVERNPGCSMRSVRDAVRGRNSEKDEAVKRLLRTGEIEDRGGDRGMVLHISENPRRHRAGARRARAGRTGWGEGEGEVCPEVGETPIGGSPNRARPPGPPRCSNGCGRPVGRDGVQCAACRYPEGG
jgi:hypothetical protein